MQNNPKNTLTTNDLRLLLENAIKIDDEMTYKQTVNHVLYCLLDMVETLQKDSHKPQNVLVHGIDCPKEPHQKNGIGQSRGYLHSERDDTPYDVDGATYCGRCHVAL